VSGRREGFEVGRKHVTTLMRKMGIEALYRKPRTSGRDREHPVFPYLLFSLDRRTATNRNRLVNPLAQSVAVNSARLSGMARPPHDRTHMAATEVAKSCAAMFSTPSAPCPRSVPRGLALRMASVAQESDARVGIEVGSH